MIKRKIKTVKNMIKRKIKCADLIFYNRIIKVSSDYNSNNSFNFNCDYIYCN